MKKSIFQTAPARALILTLAVGALGGYVAMVSCSRTVTPPAPSAPTTAPAAQATPQVAPASPHLEKEADGVPTNTRGPEADRIYGPASKSDIVLPPVVKKPAPDRRLYGPATKSILVIKPPREEAAPAQPTQAPAKAPAPSNK